MTPIVAERIVAGTAATLTATFVDQHGEPADPAGTVTVRVQAADGTDVLPAGTSTTVDGTSRSVALTAAQTAALGVLTATWTDGGDSSALTSLHEICGGVYFSVAAARDRDPGLQSRTIAELLRLRRDVEDEFESICDVAFVPRFARVRRAGSGRSALLLPDPMVRRVRSVRTSSDGTNWTTFTADELAAIGVDDSGLITRLDGGTFPAGDVIVEYEHGYDQPPAEIARYAIKRLRLLANEPTSGVPSRATSFQVGEGGTFRLQTASRFAVGDPDIDAALARHSWRTPGIG